MSAYDALRPKHKAFVDAYRRARNAAAAARIAGYSVKSARCRGYVLLKREDILAALAEPVRRGGSSPYGRLRPRHRAFLDAYCRHWNRALAAISAGYSPRCARYYAHRLLKREDISAALKERQDRIAMQNEVEIKEVIATLTKMLRANVLDFVSIGDDGNAYVDLSKLTREQAEVVSELIIESPNAARSTGARIGRGGNLPKVRLKLDKLAAADKLMKHLGGYPTERREPAGKDGAATGPKPMTNHERAKALLAILARAKAEREGE